MKIRSGFVSNSSSSSFILIGYKIDDKEEFIENINNQNKVIYWDFNSGHLPEIIQSIEQYETILTDNNNNHNFFRAFEFQEISSEGYMSEAISGKVDPTELKNKEIVYHIEEINC